MTGSLEAIYLSLGSNLGDRMKNLREALKFLSEEADIVAISSVYETEPFGVVNQPAFLNLACQIKSSLSPEELLRLAQGIERKLGRTTNSHNAPRTIDIDIIAYNEIMLNSPELTIPHPGLKERAFVLVPLVEIAPDLRVPPGDKTVARILEELGEETGKVRKVGVIDVSNINCRRV